MARGKVFLVGAGPGDPGLISVRGLELLAAADFVLYDALAHPALREVCRPDAELRNVGKRFGEPSSAQEAINAELIALAQAGHNVVRLKGGDPLLFARGAEEALALRGAGIAFEIVPAVSSPIGAAAYAGIPLTHRELSSSVTFITGSDRAGVPWSPDSWKKLATATDTICVLMGMRRIDAICAAIVEGGRAPATPAAVIQWGARAAQRVVTGTLATIADVARAAGLANPAVIVVGEVVALREELAWFEALPLFGKRLLVPRPSGQAARTARAIRERGGEPTVMPLIAITAPPDPAPLTQALAALSSYDWVLFTSENGVVWAFDALRASGRDARAFGAARIGVIGPRTGTALERYGLVADLVAEEHVGEGLARDILSRGTPRRVLVLRALSARDALPNTLREAGATVDVVAAYETKPVPEAAPKLRELLETRALDAVLLTSSSTAESLVERLGARAVELLSGLTIASIGPVTTKTAEGLGLRVAVTASTYTVDGLLDALERHYRGG
ncbi:MAG TPA: uroporphyrinogen-III C-methyltransferase [Polyangiaceae bacterium]|nr:uroporphyrinogen-III C-methyltransferase [Polyangiaceae bacterium]